MRTVIFAILSIFIIGFSHLPANAQLNSDTIMQEGRDIAAWAQDASTIVTEIVTLFLAPEIDQALDAIEQDDLDTAKRLTDSYGEFRKSKLNEINRALGNLSDVPSMKNLAKHDPKKVGRLQTAYKAMVTSLPGMYDEAAQASGQLHTLLLRMSKGEDAGILEIARQQNLAFIRLIEAENLQAQAAIIALEESHPNHAHQSIILAFNNASIAELEMINLELENPTTLSDRVPFNQVITDELETVKIQIARGRSSNKLMLVKLKSLKDGVRTRSEKNYMQKIIDAFQTYPSTFDVEQKLLENSRQLVSIYKSDRLSDDYQEEVDALQADAVKLTLNRMELMDNRIALIAQ